MYNLQTITIALHRLRDWLQLSHLLQRHTQLPLNFPGLDCPQDLKTALLDIPTPQSIPLPLINSVEETETLLKWLQTFDLQTSLTLYSESSSEPLTLSFLTTTHLHMGLPYNDRKILIDILPALKDGDSRRSLLGFSGSTTRCSTREGLQRISADFDRLSSGENI